MKSRLFRIPIRAVISLLAVLIAAIGSQSGLTRNQDAGARAVEGNKYTAVITAYCRRSNAVLFHPNSGKIYASIPSGTDPQGNSIARIDPLTGTIEQSTWIGSEPKKLALAVDGHTIYVGIDGALSIRKFDAATETPGYQSPVGVAPFYGPMRLSDFALSPVDPNVVAVSRYGVPDSIAVFDDGVARPNVAGASGVALSFTNSESTLYATSSTPLRKMSVDPSGITSVTSLTTPPRGKFMQSLGDRLYTSYGNIFQASDGAMLGTFALGDYIPDQPFVIDAASHKILYVARTYYGLRIEAFDLTTHELLGYAVVDNELNEHPLSVARWGANGLAVSMRNAPTLFIQSDLIGTGMMLPPATPQLPAPVVEPAAYTRQLNIRNNDLVFNHRDRLLYASIPSSATGPIANTITRIDPETGAVVSSAIIGNDPHKMGLSEDGETLYVALHGAAAVRRFDTVTQTPGLQFEIPNRFHQASSFAIFPGSPQSAAIAFGQAGLLIFDNGVYRPQWLDSSIGWVAHNGTPNVLYAVTSTTPTQLYKLSVSPTGMTVVTNMRQDVPRTVYDGERIYGTSSSGGRVVDPETNRVLGTFAESDIRVIAVDEGSGRVFFAGRDNVEVFDIHTFNKIGSITLPYDESAFYPKTVVRWGHNGLAISVPTIIGGGSSITLVQSSFIGPTRPFDFDADGKTDLGIFRPDVGEWWINRSSTGATFAAQFGASTDKIVPVDYTGDGKTDVAFWRPETGEWFVLRSEDGSFFTFPFGANGDVPVPADYDADGKADPAVFRPSDATWYIQRSSDNGTTIAQFGATGDQPVAADYDGDGKADLAIYRPSNGQWWLNRSTGGVIVYQFGNDTDRAVQGDYTGDGKADVAFWRPSTGEWFILRSEDTSYYSAPFGSSGDIPAPGDYDGDGKFDTTVFRPSSATWYVQRTTGGTIIQQFGANGDQPVASAFVR